MVGKQNHKVFNLIVMIIISISMISVLNISYANEKEFDVSENIQVATIFQAEDNNPVTGTNRDYTPPDADTNYEEDNSGSLWSRKNTNEFFKEVRKNVALWYTILRYMAIAIMLALLVVISIRMAFASLAEERALYKKMIMDWVTCFILLFFIHYFMMLVLYINETLVNMFKDFAMRMNPEPERGLYETARSRAYDVKFTIGFSGMFMYMALVYLTVKYIFMYAKRFIIMVILTIMAPIIVLFYAIQKILFGKSKVFTKWMEEYATNVLLQSVHAMVYGLFVTLALKVSNTSLAGFLLSFVFLNFLTKADSTFRKIFKFSSGSKMTDEVAKSDLRELTNTAGGVIAAGVVAKQTGIGKKLGSYYSGIGRLAAKPLIAGASKLKNTETGTKISDAIDDWRKDRHENKYLEFGKQLQDIDFERDGLQEDLRNATSQDEKDRIEEAIAQTKAKEDAVLKKMQSYNARRAYFAGIKKFLDPDSYMETVRDEDGNVVTDSKGRDKKRVVKAIKLEDLETGEKRKVGGLSQTIKRNANNIIKFSDGQKKILKEARKSVRSGVLGFGGLILGMGMVADNPSVGLSLIAANTLTLRGLAKDDTKSKVKVSGKMKRAIRKVQRMRNRKFTDPEFSTGSYISIDREIRKLAKTDPSVERINHLISIIQNDSLRYFVPLSPFILTSTRGMLVNALKLGRKSVKQYMQDVRDYEVSVDVAVSKAISKEIVTTVRHQVENILKKNVVSLMIEKRMRDGTMFESKDGYLFAFQNPADQDVTTPEYRARQAIINTAMQKHIYDLSRLDLENESTRKLLLHNLKQEGFFDAQQFQSNFKIERIFSGNPLEQGIYGQGILSFFEELKQQEPDLMKTKVFEMVVTQYAREHDIRTKSELESQGVYAAIKNAYLEEISRDYHDREIKAILLRAAAQSSEKFGNVSTRELLDIIRANNSEEYARVEQALTASGHSDNIEEQLDRKKKQINTALDNMIIGALINNGIVDATAVDFEGAHDAETLRFKSDLMSYMSLAGIEVDESTLGRLVQEKLDDISPEQIEQAIIRDTVSEFISDKCDGDASKLEDESVKEQLNQMVIERLKQAKGTDEEKSEVDDVLGILGGKRIEAEKSAEDGSFPFGFMSEEDVDDDKKDEDLDISIPFPKVSTKLTGKKFFCTFFVPDGLEDITIETCVRTEKNPNSKFVSNLDTVNIESEDEVIQARLVKGGKHGPTLIINYPESAIKIVKKIEKTQQKETDRRDADKVGDADRVGMSVLQSLQEIKGNSDDGDIIQEMFGEETADKITDTETEQEFKKLEIQGYKNQLTDIMSQIQKTKTKFAKRDDDSQTLYDKIMRKADELTYEEYSYTDADYSVVQDDILKKLFQAKLLHEDAEKLKAGKDEKKKIEKHMKSSREAVQQMNIDEIISDFNRKRGI